MASVRIEVWVVNFGRGVSAEEFRRNVRKVLAAADPERAVIICQEVDEADAPNEHKIIAQEAGPQYDFAGWQTAVPILLSRARFRLDADEVHFAAKGLAGVSPHRVVTDALTSVRRIARRRRGQLRRDLPPFVFLDLHIALLRKGTRTRRVAARAKLTAVARAHAAQGRIVVWGSDTNTHGVFAPLVPGEVRVIEAGIDRVGVLAPKGWRVDVVQRKTVDLTIDSHNAHGVVLAFIR